MEDLDNRMKRIIGQLRGVQKMVKSERDVSDILQQMLAIKRAIDGLSKEIVLAYMNQELPENKRKKMIELIERAVNL